MHDLQDLIHDLIEMGCVALMYFIYHITMNQIVGVFTLVLIFIKIGNELMVRQKLRKEEKDKSNSKPQ